MEPRDFVREFAEDRIVGGLELPSCQKAHHRRHEAERRSRAPGDQGTPRDTRTYMGTVWAPGRSAPRAGNSTERLGRGDFRTAGASVIVFRVGFAVSAIGLLTEWG